MPCIMHDHDVTVVVFVMVGVVVVVEVVYWLTRCGGEYVSHELMACSCLNY